MKKITAIYGTGGHAKVIYDILNLNRISIDFFLDDSPSVQALYGHPVYLPDLAPKFDQLIIGIGDNQIRHNKYNHYRKLKVQFINAIHPSAIISSTASIGTGICINAGAIINTESKISNNSIINTGAIIDHDCLIGLSSHIAPGTNLAGQVTVQEGAFIGIGCSIIPNKIIGIWSVCGAGSVIIKNVPEHTLVVGVPAQPIRKLKWITFRNSLLKADDPLGTILCQFGLLFPKP
jgi:sugar O-acyltransferase (sialic acid O-acetyltransferase NeuD family)